MGKLNDIDKKSAEKGSGWQTAWQFVKFTVVSLLACFVQFASLNIMLLLPAVKNMETQSFKWFVFNYDEAAGGLGMFIAFNAANVLAQIVAFFVNREKTFGANNNVAVTLAIYLVFTVGLVCFSAWFAPVLTTAFLSKGLNEQLAGNIATAICSFIQFVIYFPVDKLLMREKKTK